MGSVKPENECINCGRICWGKQCFKCMKKGKYNGLSRKKTRERYMRRKLYG